MNQAIIENVEISGRKEVREPKSELVNFTSKDKRAESQSIGTEKKILIPKISHGVITIWARKPNIKLAK